MANKLKYMFLDYPDNVKSDKWTIIYFDKKGRSYRCPIDIFPDEKTAQDRINLSMTWRGIQSRVNGTILWKIMRSNLSHAIAMPMKS